MSRVVTIDSVTVHEENEIIEHFKRNDELESVEITIKNTTQIEPYDMGLQCTITEDGNTDYYITGADDIVRTAIGKYNHKITLIEAYKIFEREVTASLQYTQALNTTTYTCLDVLDRGLKLVTIEKTSDLGSSRKYDISGLGARDSNDNYIVSNLSGFALMLYNKKAPEIKYNTPSLREQFDEVFLLFDGRPILEEFTTINIKYYNEDNEEIDIEDVDEITGHQDIEKNAKKFDIYMENAVSENNVNKQARIYPSSSAWGSVRSSDTELTTNNFLMEVNEEIERPLEFKIRADVTVGYTQYDPDAPAGSRTSNEKFVGNIEVDMTDWLFTERAWNALKYKYASITNSTGTTPTWWNTISKSAALYFSGNQILGWHQELDIWSAFGTLKTYNAFIGAAAYKGGYLTVDAGTYLYSVDTVNVLTTSFKPIVNTIRDFMFRLKYVPKETVRIQLERDADVGFGTLRANQTARIVDAELLGNNMQSKLNRDGAKELKFSKLVKSYSDAFDVRDYYGTYKGVSVDNTRYSNGKTLSTISLSEHYAKKSARIDIANRPRQTEISAENTIRNDIINEYMKVSLLDFTADSSLNEVGVERYARTFSDTISYTTPVEFAIWEDSIYVETTSQGIGKTMSFKFEFPNNISAGKQTILLDTIYGNNEVQYATDGVIDNATIKFYDTFESYVVTESAKAQVGQLLPEINEGTSIGDVTLGNELIDLGERRILKDSGEVYALSYQLTHYTNDEELFIGNKLAQNNALVVKDMEDLYLYRLFEPIQVGQNIDISNASLQKQKVVSGIPTASQVKLEITKISSGNNTRYRYQFTNNFISTRYWALCNEAGEVYLICNKTDQDTFYIGGKYERD
jgi:hypothetical protein